LGPYWYTPYFASSDDVIVDPTYGAVKRKTRGRFLLLIG
jgi:hypothetical protein